MKDTLLTGEFAIADGATFKAASRGKITISSNGNLVLTFELESPTTKLQTKLGLITIGNCGVFKILEDEFASGTISNITLEARTDQIRIKSSNNDVDLITNGVKGEHGNQDQKNPNVT